VQQDRNENLIVSRVDVGCSWQPNHVNSYVVYFMQLIRDYVCCFRVRFSHQVVSELWFVYTLEIGLAKINQRDVKIAAATAFQR